MKKYLPDCNSYPKKDHCSILIIVFLLISNCSFLFGQDPNVRGKVTDETGSPVPGISIIVKGSTSGGTAADVDGLFSIAASPTDTLVFNGVGFSEQNVPATLAQSVTMKSDANQLSEIVVTALGIKKEKRTVGYAMQEVQGRDLVKAREPNPINNLTGKVAGLTVGPSAELLGSPNVLLRGRSDVLFVVDGVPINSDLWNISPDDIESINVLKGPTAAALYGSRGVNGAMIITTKRGTNDPRGYSVQFNSSTLFQNGIVAIPKPQDTYGPGDHGVYEFVDGKGGGKNDGDYDVWGPKFNGQAIKQYDSPVDPVTGVRSATPWVARGKDNLKRFLQTGIISTNNIAFSTSNERADLRVSATQTSQKGTIPYTGLNSTNFNVNTGVNLGKKFRSETNFNFNYQYSDNVPDVTYGPNSLIYNVVIWAGADWNIDDMKQIWQPGKEGIQQNYEEYQRYNNPYLVAKEWKRGHNRKDIYGYTLLKYTLNKELDVQLRTQVSTYDLIRTEKMPYSAGSYSRELRKGDYREDKRNLFENNTDILLNYNKTAIASFLDLHISLGANARNWFYNSSFASTDYLNVPGWYNLNNSLNPRRSYNFNSAMLVLSSYGVVDFGFSKYANLSVTGRIDKHSSLPSLTNSYFYPSVSLSTVFSDYVKLPSGISFLKVRGSFARVGSAFTSANVGPFSPINSNSTNIGSTSASYLNPLSYGTPYLSPYGGPTYQNVSVYNIAFPYNNLPAATYTSTKTNQGLKANFSNMTEAGLDLKFLQNRIGFDATYFTSTDGPQIFLLPTSEATGFSNQLVNGIKTQRRGWELTLSGSPFRNKGKGKFSWDVLANWSTYKETLKEIYPGISSLNTFYKVGDRVDALYLTAFAKTHEGKVIYDKAGLPLRNPINQKLGFGNPDWVWGVNNKFTYKGIFLTFQFDGRVGGKMVNYIRQKTFQGGRNIETTEGALGAARDNDVKGIKSYVGDGVSVVGGTGLQYDVNGNITNYSELQFTPNTTQTYAQDWVSKYWGTTEASMISKTYGKLREITIGYNIPSEILKNGFFKQASIAFVARNILYFAHKDAKDVDLDQFPATVSTSALQSPTFRSYGFNLNFTF